MTASIVAILAVLIPFGIWLYKKNSAEKADPAQQNRERYDQIDQDIAKGDALAAGAHASADLDELERLQKLRGDQRGPAGDDAAGR